MTVAELIAELQKMPQEAPVMVREPEYGGYDEVARPERANVAPGGPAGCDWQDWPTLATVAVVLRV